MKLHLPTSLRKALLAVIAAVAVQPVTGAVYSGSIGQTLYTDFADNCGLFSTHNVNEMLRAVREKEGGVVIYYDNAKYENYVMPQEMISFESQVDGGYAAGVGYNFIATVAHNGVIDPTFSGTKVGSANAIRYSGIEYRSSTNNAFLLSPNWDYKITRLSKIVTDVTMSEPNTGSFGENWGRMLYRSGSGTMQAADENGNWTWMAGGYSFNLGGMMTVDSSYRYHNGTDVRGVYDDSGFFTVTVDNKWVASNDPNVQSPINPTDPMPFCGLGGDSGSPTWFWNSDTNSYVYAGAVVGGNLSTVTYVYYAPQWTASTMDYFNCKVKLDDTTHDLTIHAVGSEAGETRYDATNKVMGTTHAGTVTATDTDSVLASFNGVVQGARTWNDLRSEKDKLNWFNYGGENTYLNATNDSANPANGKMTYADLFYTQNLVFEARDGEQYNIRLDATVDTGIGYTQFSTLAGVDRASFVVSANNDSYQLNTAGFVVDAGVEVHLKLTGEQGYLREWRKTGDGDLFIEGTGNNDILLNLGGNGATYLKRQDGYAAYNVLASSGAAVIVDDVRQIKRDFTFGNGGGFLDMNGNDIDLLRADTAKNNDTGFSIHALTQEAVITNSSAKDVRLTWKDTEWDSNNKATFLGSFRDMEGKGSLVFAYDAADHTLTLNSIYTCLENEGSSITVKNGTLALQGSLTVHAPGSAALPGNNSRLVNKEDWHYADMKAPVVVEGGTFELGHHARLQGDVKVNAGGTFLVREGVTHQWEYIEGSYEKFNTDDFNKFFGLKGNVVLEGGDSVMKMEFNSGADSRLVYGGSVSGRGKLIVNSGTDGGIIELTGSTVGMSGEKIVAGGGLVVSNLTALGSESARWEIMDAGWFKLNVEGKSAKDALPYVAENSAGVLILNQGAGAEPVDLLNMAGYDDLFVGVSEGEKIHYGTAVSTLETNSRSEWRLGGGGGELVVNAKLAKDGGKLVLGNQYTTGTVTLTNAGNQISHIDFAGRVTLNYTSEDALGNAHINLGYANRIMGRDGIETRIGQGSSGVILMDNMNQAAGLNLSCLENVSLGANGNYDYMGRVDIGSSNTYRFGGGSGTLSIIQVLENNGDTARNLVVDGQTYSGGVTKLRQQATLTGTVTVQGYDSTKVDTNIGDATLTFSSSNALTKAAEVIVKDGGRIDLAGTAQTFNNLEIQSGGMIVNSRNDGAKELTVAMSRNLQWRGVVDTSKIVISGNNTLTLYGKTIYDEMRIQSGSQVALGANDTLSATGKTFIEQGATLHANKMKTAGEVVVGGTLNAADASFAGVVKLQGGNLNIKDGTLNSDSTLFSYGGTISGLRATLASDSHFMEGVSTFDAGDYGSAIHARISGNVEIADGAVLRLAYGEKVVIPFPVATYAYYEYDISSSEFNTGENGGTGTLYVETNRLFLTGSNQNFGGTVKLGNRNVQIEGKSGLKAIDKLELTGGNATLTGGASWDIGNITGQGNLTVDTANRLSVTGEGNWTGTLTKSSSGTLSISGEKALYKAAVQLNNSAKLEVDNDLVQLGKLGGVANTSILAGEHVRAGEAATLEILSAGTYSGSVKERAVGTSGDMSYVSLLMNGTGTFAMGGTDITVKDITVQQGSLAFTDASATVQVKDSINIARGAELCMAGGLGLAPGQTLSVMASESNPAASAVLAGDLAFGGGILSFSGPAMNAGGAALLSVTGNISCGSGLQIDFTDTGDIQFGKEYHLMSSTNRGAINEESVSSDLTYLQAMFISKENGLWVQFQTKDNSRIWTGTNDQHQWNGNTFGQSGALAEDMQAVFTNTAQCKTVDVTEAVQVAGLVFDSSGKYTVSASESGSLASGQLVQMGSGTTELGRGVTVTGTADVKTGKLVLEVGSRVERIAMADGTALQVNHDECGIQSITGKGAVEMKMAAGQDFNLDKLQDSFSLVLAGEGSYASSGAVNTGRMAVKDGATLSLAGAALNTGGGTVVLGGNLEMTIAADTELDQDIAADTQIITHGEEDKEDEIISCRGNITKSSTGTLTIGANVTANRLAVEAGSVTVGQAASLDVNELLINRGSVTVQKDGGATKSIASMTMGDGTAFTLVNATETSSALALDSLTLTGSSAIIEQRNNVGGIRIAAVQQDEAACTLNLVSNTSSTKVALFELGSAGQQSGSINGDICMHNASGANNRSTALIVSDGEMTREAHIDMTSVGQTGVKMALGLNADTVTITGLSSGSNLGNARAEVFSGSVNLNADTNNDVFNGDGKTRTLQVLTKGDSTFYGDIDGNINITVGGTGTQAFMGSSIAFDGSLEVKDNATLALGDLATAMLGTASSLTVGEHATLQTGAAISIRNTADIKGTLAMGGTVTALSELKLGNDVSIILGGGYTGNDNVRTYDVFIEGENGSVTGWEKLTSASFGGFGSLDRGAEITVKQRTDDGRYQVQVNMNNIQNTAITWSEDVAVGTWDSDSANFMEGGERTAYYAGDTVSIATDATISMGAAVNLRATGERTDAGTLTVQGGANAAVNQTAENSLTMEVLHVTDESRLVMNSLAGNYAATAIVDKGSTLESTIAAIGASGTVGRLEGEGTFSIQNTGTLDLGNNSVSGGAVDASAFTGTVEIGNGSQQVRFRSSNITGLSGQATIEVDNQAQYWVTDNNGVVNANLVLHGNSGAAKGNSWSGEGFGAVRDASAFNGDITIDGNASVSGHNGRRNVVFNGKLQGYGESGQDTLTMACYYAANTMTYTFSSAADASGLDSFVLRRSGNDTNGNGSVANIEGDKGLAKSVEFYAGTADSAVLNIKADASAERLKSAAGDGVVNIGEGKSLELTKGADYGGQINLGAAVAASTADAAEGAVARVSGDVRFSMADATHASIAGAANGSTRVENMAIDLAAGTRLEMENITLSATSSITDAEATLVANSLVVEAQVGGNLKPLTYGDASPAPEARETGEVVSFTLSNIQDVAIEGTGLMVRLVGDSATALGGAEWLELGLGTDAVFTDSLAVTLLFTGADGQAMAVQGVYTLPTAEAVALAAEAAQPHDYVYFHLAGAAGVPEPASATLSLLALAALAARRRRKG